jgi:uncharacterized membrane protein YhaH (DUF805 family)
MGFFEAVKTCLTKYVTFNGRARRSEFWWFFLFSALLGIIFSWVPVVRQAVQLAILLPSLAVNIRRLHDLDRSGWFILLPLPAMIVAAIFGVIGLAEQSSKPGRFFWMAGIFGLIAAVCYVVLLVWYCEKGTTGRNRFGEDPIPA